MYTRHSRPKSLPMTHLISDPTMLETQTIATPLEPLVHCSLRVSIPANRYGFPSSHLGTSISALLVALSNFDIITSYSQTAKYDCWQQAMQKKITTLEANHIQDVVSCPLTLCLQVANRSIQSKYNPMELVLLQISACKTWK